MSSFKIIIRLKKYRRKAFVPCGELFQPTSLVPNNFSFSIDHFWGFFVSRKSIFDISFCSGGVWSIAQGG